MESEWAVLTLDEQNRVVLHRNVREIGGIRRCGKPVAAPFKEGVKLIDVTGKSFVGRTPGFEYREEMHESSKFLFRNTMNTCKQRKRNER